MKQPQDLIWDSEVNPDTDFESTYDQFQSEYFGDMAKYSELSNRRNKARERLTAGDSFDVPQHSVRMVEMAVLASVTSVRTVTERWEDLTRSYLRGELTAEEFAGETRDGDVKAEKVAHVLESDIPRHTTSALRRFGDTETAREYLMGRKTGDTDETYLRATKANFVLWLLGYDTVCVDHRIHRAIRPVIPKVLRDVPATDGDVAKGRKADRARLRPTDVEFWHDGLKWDVESYDVLADAVVDNLAENTDVPRDRITQVAFNVGGDGERTTHADLLRILAGA